MGYSQTLEANISLDSIFQLANGLYQDQQYEQAIDRYQLLIRDYGIHQADVYYNLGNSYLKIKDVAHSILFLEKAVSIHPHNADYRFNLQLARSLQEDDFGLIDDFFLIRWFRDAARLMSSTAWAVMTFLFISLAVGLILIWLFHTRYEIKKMAFYVGMFFFLLTLVSTILGFGRQSLERNNPYAIVMSSEQILKIAPDNQSKEVVVVHQGLKVKVIDSLGDWSKVELSNKEVGWLPTELIERI